MRINKKAGYPTSIIKQRSVAFEKFKHPFCALPATPAIHLAVNRTIPEIRKLCFAKRKEYAMKNDKMSPKGPVCHCNPDVPPVFFENSSVKNGGIQPFLTVVYHSDPSVPISVSRPFNSG